MSRQTGRTGAAQIVWIAGTLGVHSSHARLTCNDVRHVNLIDVCLLAQHSCGLRPMYEASILLLGITRLHEAQVECLKKELQRMRAQVQRPAPRSMTSKRKSPDAHTYTHDGPTTFTWPDICTPDTLTCEFHVRPWQDRHRRIDGRPTTLNVCTEPCIPLPHIPDIPLPATWDPIGPCTIIPHDQAFDLGIDPDPPSWPSTSSSTLLSDTPWDQRTGPLDSMHRRHIVVAASSTEPHFTPPKRAAWLKPKKTKHRPCPWDRKTGYSACEWDQVCRAKASNIAQADPRVNMLRPTWPSGTVPRLYHLTTPMLVPLWDATVGETLGRLDHHFQQKHEACREKALAKFQGVVSPPSQEPDLASLDPAGHVSEEYTSEVGRAWPTSTDDPSHMDYFPWSHMGQVPLDPLEECAVNDSFSSANTSIVQHALQLQSPGLSWDSVYQRRWSDSAREPNSVSTSTHLISSMDAVRLGAQKAVTELKTHGPDDVTAKLEPETFDFLIYMRIVAQSKMGAPVIKFQELIPSTNQGPRVPAQALWHILTLASMGACTLAQTQPYAPLSIHVT